MQDPFRFFRLPHRMRAPKKTDPYTEYVQRSRPELPKQRRERMLRAIAYMAAALILGVLLAFLLNRT